MTTLTLYHMTLITFNNVLKVTHCYFYNAHKWLSSTDNNNWNEGPTRKKITFLSHDNPLLTIITDTTVVI